jgi:hypothetical protein
MRRTKKPRPKIDLKSCEKIRGFIKNKTRSKNKIMETTKCLFID